MNEQVEVRVLEAKKRYLSMSTQGGFVQVERCEGGKEVLVTLRRGNGEILGWVLVPAGIGLEPGCWPGGKAQEERGEDDPSETYYVVVDVIEARARHMPRKAQGCTLFIDTCVGGFLVTVSEKECGNILGWVVVAGGEGLSAGHWFERASSPGFPPKGKGSARPEVAGR